MTGPIAWWHPANHADRRPFLHARHSIKRAIERWLEAKGFLEVEPSILQVSPGNETHLHAFAATLRATDGTSCAELYLHTSPELAMKKILAAGETRIYALARVFRNRERGPLHHPEFTMLEWYRADAGYETVMADCAALVACAAEAVGCRAFDFRDRTADPHAPPEHLTVVEAFHRYAGIDLLASMDRDGGTDRDALTAAARGAGIRVAEDDGWSDIFSRVLVERIEPVLGSGRATILQDYPVAEAALARRKADDPRLAERFELYACGVELANGFGELTDPVEQRRRFTLEMAEKQRIYGETYPLDEDFLAALALMPPSSGVAMGFDRLVMLATGATHIEQVTWTPVTAGTAPS